MKVSATLFLLAFLMFFPLTSSAQSFNAYVSGDTVTLWETQAWRNCGSMYTASVTLQDHTLNWYQLDTGMTATCYCVFDLSVTYCPLDPGDYTANFYYTDAWAPTDTIYEGSVDFTINSGKSVRGDGGVINNYQSDCYSGQGIKDQDENLAFRVFPVPVSLGEIINIESEKVLGNAVLEIYTISGQKVYSKEYYGKSRVIDQLNTEYILSGSGLYIFKFSSVQGISTRLVSVLK
jgi:hypothetical protein